MKCSLQLAQGRTLYCLMGGRVFQILLVLAFTVYMVYDRVGPAVARGILEHDEGHALLNANTWHHIMKWVLGGGPFSSDAAAVANLRDSLHQQGGTLYSAGKFGYSLLLAVAALPAEVTQAQALIMAALCGILVSLLAGLLAFQYSKSFDSFYVAQLGCFFSPLLASLGSEVSGTIWALMFGLAAANVLYYGSGPHRSRRARWSWGVLGGALLGYGFTCHFNLAPFVVAVFIATGISASSGYGGWGRVNVFFSSLVPAAVGSLGMLALFEIVTRIVDYRLRDVFPEYLSFFGEHRRLFFRDQVPMLEGVLYGDGAIGWGKDAWLIYWNVVKNEFLWAPLLVVALAMGVVKRRQYPQGLASAAALLFVPLLFWLAYVYRVERVMGMCIAASWVFIGALAGPSIEKNREKFAPQYLFALILVAQMSSADRVIERRSIDFNPLYHVVFPTLTYMNDNGGLITAGSFDTGFAPLWKWTLVEQLRRPRFSGIREKVDFSRFTDAEIVFIDPSTWRRPSGDEFTISREQAGEARTILHQNFEQPPWTITVKDLRYPAEDDKTTVAAHLRNQPAEF